MSLIQFAPKNSLRPHFAIKLCPALHRVVSYLSQDKAEGVVKESLGIKEKRVVQLVPVRDRQQNEGTIVLLYDYFYDKHMPVLEIPQNSDGSFEFKIYDLDFNQEIRLEEMFKHIESI